LQESWKARGLGIRLGKFGGYPECFEQWLAKHNLHVQGMNPQELTVCALTFVDDIYLVAHSTADAAIMLQEVESALRKFGLFLQQQKLKWMANKHVLEQTLQHGNNQLPRHATLVVLGSMLTDHGNELQAYEHRISQSWKCFFRWKQALVCKTASLESRLALWQKTVLCSLLWCLETLRPLQWAYRRIRTTVALQIAIMMGLKRRFQEQPETWLEWHKRRYSTAHRVAMTHHVDIISVLTNKRRKWAGHISRFGVKPRAAHLLKAIILWRPLSWWKTQQVALDLGLSRFRHPGHIHPTRWEEQFGSNWLFEQLDSN
jgi:hypothetical protein